MGGRGRDGEGEIGLRFGEGTKAAVAHSAGFGDEGGWGEEAWCLVRVKKAERGGFYSPGERRWE